MKTTARNPRVAAMALAQVLVLCGPLAAANRFFVENKDLLVGATAQTISIRCDNDFSLYGFSMAIKYEQAKIRVTAIELAGAWSSPAVNNDVWKDLKFDNATGDIIMGVVYDFSPLGPDDNFVPVGTNHPVVTLTVDVLSSGPTTTLVDFRDRAASPGKPEIKNIMTNSSALTVTPTLADQNLTIKSLVPVITSITLNTGKAGAEFFAVVTNLDVTGVTIAVEVCGVALVQDAANGFRLLADKRTLSITAPPCAPSGWAALKVTTQHGSDTETNGFNYLPPPVITQITGNQGEAGKVFQVVGQNFNRPGRTVKVCGVDAASTLRADGVTLDVTAPACAAGWAVLEVCTTDGCDSEANGFNYQQQTGTLFVRGDANNDRDVDIGDAVSILNDLFLGSPALNPCRDSLDTNDSGDLDLTDGIIILSYLFQGGVAPRPPFPDPGLDTTPSAQLSCPRA